jgi:spore germination protein KB
MAKETITLRQAVFIVFMFISGTFIMLNLDPKAEQDTWISMLMGAVAAIPLMLVYARITRLFPCMDIFQIIKALFGVVVAKTLTLLLVWYSLGLFALVMRSFADFIKIASMPETPQLPILLIMMLMAAYIVRSGIESLGKFSIVGFGVIIFVVIITSVLSLNKIDFSNMQPVLAHDIGALSSGAFSFLMFPLAETVLILGIADSIKKTDSPRRIYLVGIALSVAVALAVVVRNIGLLGVPMMQAEYYPSYITVRLISVGDVLTRVEGTISMNYILAGFTKTALCLLVASKGLASLFGVENYKTLVLPAGLLGLALSATVYNSAMELVGYFSAYSIYVVPFGIVLPLIVWIAAEAKTKRAGRAPGKI